MTKRIIIICLLIVFALSPSTGVLSAQMNDVARQILQIKRDGSYIHAESYAETWQEAYDFSISQLLLQVNNDRSNIGLERLKVETLLSFVNCLSTNRGPMQRVFLYVRCSDLDLISCQDGTRSDTTAIIVSISPVDLQDDQFRNPMILPIKLETQTELTENVIASFRMAETSDEAKLLLRTFHKEGKITAFDSVKSEADLVPGRYLLVSYQRRFIKALLQVREEGIFNIKKKQFDSLDNYSDCKIVWFY